MSSGMFYMILLIAGAVMLIVGIFMSRSNSKRKTRDQRLEEMFADYDTRMEEFKKKRSK